MCGRYVLEKAPARLQAYFRLAAPPAPFAPRWNIAPSQRAPVVVESDAGRVLEFAQWGLIPSWAKDPATLPRPINAKSETAADKPMFRHAYRKRRVLVPADGFYEWLAASGGKQPFYIRAVSGEPLAFGGLLEHWAGPDGELATFTILTTDPNELMRKIHNRMPAIIQPADFDRWLDRSLVEPTEIGELLRPAPDELLEAYPVSRRVNSPANDGAELIERVGI